MESPGPSPSIPPNESCGSSVQGPSPDQRRRRRGRPKPHPRLNDERPLGRRGLQNCQQSLMTTNRRHQSPQRGAQVIRRVRSDLSDHILRKVQQDRAGMRLPLVGESRCGRDEYRHPQDRGRRGKDKALHGPSLHPRSMRTPCARPSRGTGASSARTGSSAPSWSWHWPWLFTVGPRRFEGSIDDGLVQSTGPGMVARVGADFLAAIAGPPLAPCDLRRRPPKRKGRSSRTDPFFVNVNALGALTWAS